MKTYRMKEKSRYRAGTRYLEMCRQCWNTGGVVNPLCEADLRY
nr:MAG TPA: hypothetical protein [Caudoviricetes sp.]